MILQLQDHLATPIRTVLRLQDSPGRMGSQAHGRESPSPRPQWSTVILRQDWQNRSDWGRHRIWVGGGSPNWSDPSRWPGWPGSFSIFLGFLCVGLLQCLAFNATLNDVFMKCQSFFFVVIFQQQRFLAYSIEADRTQS